MLLKPQHTHTHKTDIVELTCKSKSLQKWGGQLKASVLAGWQMEGKKALRFVVSSGDEDDLLERCDRCM